MKLTHLVRLVRSVGVPVKIEQASTGDIVTIPRALSQAFGGRTPEAIVNAYGTSGREFVVLKADLKTMDKIRDLDVLIDGSGRYVAASATPLLEEGTGTVMGYRVYARGRS